MSSNFKDDSSDGPDKEKGMQSSTDVVQVDDDKTSTGRFSSLRAQLARLGVEARGVQRVPEDERVDTRLYGIAEVWLLLQQL
jgi:hypothetical protein